MFEQLPSGLDVYAILTAAMSQSEYRDKLLYIAGVLFGTGFVLGICVCAVFISPTIEIKARAYDKEIANSHKRNGKAN